MPLALIAATLASLGLHAAALFLPDIDLAPPPDPQPLQAEIVLQPRRAPVAQASPAVSPVAKPPAPRAVPRNKAAETVTPPPAVPAMPAEDPGETASAGLPTPLVEAAPAAGETAPPGVASPDLPPTGSIRFVVTNGETESIVGSAEHRWQMGDGRYRITSVMETAGLAALFRSIRFEAESSGRLEAGGLTPEEYSTRRSDKTRVEQVRFDWAAGVARFANGSETPLAAGAQDLLSFNYQLGWLAKTGEMGIATGRKLGLHRLELLGRETLKTEAGELSTLHFRALGSTHTEVWLAESRYLLPVKIRHVDKKGDRYELLVQEIRIPQ